MKRKVVNPDPQEKKSQQIEDKILKKEMEEELILAKEILEKKKEEK